MRSLLVIFVNLFVLTIGGILFGLHLYERNGRKKMAKMLQAGDKPEVIPISLLRELKEHTGEPTRKALQFLDFRPGLSEVLQQADLNWDTTRFMRLTGAFGLVGALVGALLPLGMSHLLLAAILGSLLAYLPWFYVNKTRTRRMADLERQLPDAMDFLARSMRAGHAFTISIGMVGDDLPEPLGREFRSLFNEQNLGAPLEVAFENFHKRVPLNDVSLFCSAAILQRRTGGNLSEILTGLAELVRDRFRLRGQVQAASAHGRMTAGILIAMPILTMVGLLVVAPGYLQGMWNDDDGRRLVGGAVVAQLLGNVVIKKIVRIRV